MRTLLSILSLTLLTGCYATLKVEKLNAIYEMPDIIGGTWKPPGQVEETETVETTKKRSLEKDTP